MTTQSRTDRARQRAADRQANQEAMLPAVPDEGNGGGQVAKTDPLRQMLNAWTADLVDQMPMHMKVNPEAFIRLVLTGMRNSKQAVQLAKCTRPSLFAALLESARFGLMPFTPEAAIVPYGQEATFIPMAQGFVKLFWNTGQIAGVVVDFVRKDEERGTDWELARGAGGGFWHRPRLEEPARDEDGRLPTPAEPLFAYCYLRMRDGTNTEPAIVMRWDAEEVMRTKSKAWQNAENKRTYDSLWHTDFPAMWLKTAVRRAAKYGPKSAELTELMMIEARDDKTRTDAPPPPKQAPPMGSGATVDYDLTIDGGKVVQGEAERIGEDGFPEGYTTAPPAGEGAEARPKAAEANAAAPPPAAQPAGPPAHEWPDVPLDGRVSPSTAGKLSRKWQESGWVGDQFRERRRVMAGVLATGGRAGVAPLDLTSPAKMTERQGRTAVLAFEALAAAAQEAGESVPGRLQRLYDALVKQQQAEAG